MGLSGWWSWLGEDIAKLEALRDMMKDEEERKVVEEVIADLKAKKEAE